MKFLKLYIVLFLTITFSACDVINPEEDIPAYIELLPFEYTAGFDGSNSTNITEAWIIVGGEFLGAFDLPKTIPILNSGEVDVIIDAGIKDNAFDPTPSIYPFYERYRETVNLVPGETISIQPRTRYDMDVTQVVFQENFDDGTINFTDVAKTVEDVKEGGGSGLIELNKDALPLLIVSSLPLEEFPTIGSTGYVEIDYKNDVPILIGVVGHDINGLEVYADFPYGLNPSTEWKKAYFNFTNMLNNLEQSNARVYQIRILSQIPLENGEFIMENAEIRLDNIKLLTF